MKKVKSIFVMAVLMSGALASVFMTSQARGETQEKTLDDALKDIQQSQGIKPGESVDCSKVTDKQFEEVGDGFMSVVHPNRQQHDFMDRMMGGDGSQSLAYMHRMMGARYLGCYNNDDYDGYGMGNMMGYGMMGNGFGYGMGPGKMRYWYQAVSGNDNDRIIDRRQTMMGYGYYPMGGWGMGWVMWIFWILIIALILRFVCRSGTCMGSLSSEKPLDILKKRYAKGEITKEEFERMKKDLEA
jgi:uncharacterized membrane protein